MKSLNFAFAASGFFLGLAVASAFFLLRPSPAITPSSVASEDLHPAFHVYMAGQVHQQGVVEIWPDEKVTVSQAIALDGGLDSFGDQKRIKLIRRLSDGTSKVIAVDLKIDQLGGARDPFVQAGDLINVPQRVADF